jgi:hypothetical protein
MPTQKNSASWDLQLGFNLAFKRLRIILNDELGSPCKKVIYQALYFIDFGGWGMRVETGGLYDDT